MHRMARGALMTMFSQKEPLNLADFLAQPVSKEALRHMADRRRKRSWSTARDTAATPASTTDAPQD